MSADVSKTPAIERQTINVGDRVEVTVHVTRWGKRAHGQGRKLSQSMRGSVVWVGPRFATVELDAGYREAFRYEELRVVGREI